MSLEISGASHLLVSRIGGDEYAILAAVLEQTEVDHLVAKIGEAVNSYNNRDWAMKMSYGYVRSSKGNMEQLFEEADRSMYVSKFGKKE